MACICLLTSYKQVFQYKYMCVFFLNKLALFINQKWSVLKEWGLSLWKMTVQRTWYKKGSFVGNILTQMSLKFVAKNSVDEKSSSVEVVSWHLAPILLTLFRSNSKFNQNLQCSGFKYSQPITMKFCTRHDSFTVVTCAKYRCDWLSIFWIRAFQIFIKFRIQSK